MNTPEPVLPEPKGSLNWTADGKDVLLPAYTRDQMLAMYKKGKAEGGEAEACRAAGGQGEAAEHISTLLKIRDRDYYTETSDGFKAIQAAVHALSKRGEPVAYQSTHPDGLKSGWLGFIRNTKEVINFLVEKEGCTIEYAYAHPAKTVEMTEEVKNAMQFCINSCPLQVEREIVANWLAKQDRHAALTAALEAKP